MISLDTKVGKAISFYASSKRDDARLNRVFWVGLLGSIFAIGAKAKLAR